MLKFYFSKLSYTHGEAAKYLRWCRLGVKGFVVGVWLASVLSLWRLCWYTGALLALIVLWAATQLSKWCGNPVVVRRPFSWVPRRLTMKHNPAIYHWLWYNFSWEV